MENICVTLKNTKISVAKQVAHDSGPIYFQLIKEGITTQINIYYPK